MTLIIDPASGWKYGFPKPCPDEVVEAGGEAMKEWMIEQGYPRADVYSEWFYYRAWEQFDGA